MSTMVERVARALCEAADDDWDWSVFFIVDANDTAETGRDVYRDMARAAIRAMSDPTPEMTAVISMGINADQVWRAMIQAALSEKGSGNE